MYQLLCVFGLMVPLQQVHASDPVEIDGLFYHIKNGECEVVNPSGRYDTTPEQYAGISELDIPEKITYEGIEYPVVSIGNYAFLSCRNLKKVNFPKTLKFIYEGAFWGCGSLREVDFPENLRYIGFASFRYCGIQNLYIPDNVTGIGGYAFDDNDLRTVRLGRSVKSVGESAFETNDSLHTLRLDAISCMNCAEEYMSPIKGPDGCAVSYICNLPQNISELIIGEDVEEIAKYSFFNATKLKKITYNAKGKRMSYDAKSVFLPTVEIVEIGSSVEVLSSRCFSGFTALKQIVVPDNVKEIRGYAFSDCVSLASVELPAGLIFGGEVFSGCTSLEYVPISEGMTAIPYGYMFGCSALKSVDIPDCVTSIHGSAFARCVGLNDLIIPDQITYIGSNCFSGCDNLASVKLSANLVTIDDYAFSGCTSLQVCDDLPQTLQSIGEYIFKGCKSTLTEITIPEGVTKIGRGAFEVCSSLYKINYNAIRVDDIAYNAKIFPNTVEDIYIGKNVRSIPDNLFKDCTQLMEVYSYSDEAPLAQSNVFYGNAYEGARLFVPKGCEESYMASDCWSRFRIRTLSGIDGVVEDGGLIESGCFDLAGRPVGDDYKGVVVVRYSDGSAKKELR